MGCGNCEWLNRLKTVPVFHLFMTTSFFLSGVLINFIQCILFYSLRYLSKTVYRIINDYLCYSIWAQLVFLAEWWSNSEVYIYTSEETLKRLGKEHALILMNHTYELDWLMAWMTCVKCDTLGSSKVFVKKVLKYVPIVGWTWNFAEAVFVQRKWEQDKIIMMNQLNELTQFPLPVWLLLFPEGTRFTPDKHVASKEFATKAGLPILEYHLTPRTKGFILTVEQLRGKFPVIYNISMGFNLKEGAKPTIRNILQGHRVVCEIYLESIPLSSLPSSEKDISDWLQNTFVKKDKLLGSYIETGSWTEKNNLPPYAKHKIPRKYGTLFNSIFWLFFINVPLLYYLLICVVERAWMPLIVAGIVVLIVFWGLHSLMGLTKISKGSSYGTSSNKESTSQKKIT